MELEYRKISEERCKEIDSWGIYDPFGKRHKLSTYGEYWVSNEDESILLCLAFFPRHDDDSHNPMYLLIIDKQYYQIFDKREVIQDKEDPELFHIKLEIIAELPKEYLKTYKEVMNFFLLVTLKNAKVDCEFYYKGEKVE